MARSAWHLLKYPPHGVCQGTHMFADTQHQPTCTALTHTCPGMQPAEKSPSVRLGPQTRGQERRGQAGSLRGCCLFSRCPLTSPLLGCFHCSTQGVRFPLKPNRSGAHVEGEYGDPGPWDLRSLTVVAPARPQLP